MALPDGFVPISMDELETITDWDGAVAFAERGVTEIRDIKERQPGEEDAARAARDTLQATKDRRDELQQIMSALIAKAPSLE